MLLTTEISIVLSAPLLLSKPHKPMMMWMGCKDEKGIESVPDPF